MTRILATAVTTAALLALPGTLATPAIAQGANPAAKSSPDGASYLPHDGSVRETSLTALQETLLEFATLRQNAHQAHWNVVGSDFYQLHEFYEELYAALDGPIDDLGARMRSLGGPVDFRASAQAERDGLAEMDVAEMDGPATYTFLLKNYAAVSARLYERIEAVSDDRPTQDLLIGLAFAIDKDLWMLRAHAGGSPE